MLTNYTFFLKDYSKTNSGKLKKKDHRELFYRAKKQSKSIVTANNSILGECP